MSNELKTVVSDEQLEFLRENFFGINDADRVRSMFRLTKYILEESREPPDFDEIFTDEALSHLDKKEITTEALKRALLESEDVNLSTIPDRVFDTESDTDAESESDSDTDADPDDAS